MINHKTSNSETFGINSIYVKKEVHKKSAKFFYETNSQKKEHERYSKLYILDT